MDQKKWRFALDIVAIVILGVLTIIVIVLQVITLAAETTRLEAGLFNILQLLLSLGFAWLLTRVVTRREFQESLEKFAISAYRRITDIDISVIRMRQEIGQMRARYPDKDVHELDILRIIASDISDTVRSSIADWADVIGEDIRKQRRLRELEDRYAVVSLTAAGPTDTTDSESSESNLAKIREEIERLRSEIPGMLAIETKHISEYDSPEVIEKALASTLATQGELLLYAEARPELSYDDLRGLQPAQELILHPGRAMHSFEFIVLQGRLEDENYRTLGVLVNPYKGLGVHEIEYYKALLNTLMPYLSRYPEGFPDVDHIPATFMGLSPPNRNQFIVRFEPRAR